MEYLVGELAIKKEVPGYPGFFVNIVGWIYDSHGQRLKYDVLSGYFVISANCKTLQISRATALAWVDNPRPDKYNIVNHLDGNPQNNYFRNLEWADYSGNNYHAVNGGLRKDNIFCLVRDFETGIVSEFPSIAQAKEFMGLRKDINTNGIIIKQFGRLINDRFEFRFKNNFEPWFYGDTRKERVKPGRYLLTVTEETGEKWEIMGSKRILKAFQLYEFKTEHIPTMVEHARIKYPKRTFGLRDAYAEQKAYVSRKGLRSIVVAIKAVRDDVTIPFKSITEAAEHFKVDRSVILSRLNKPKDYKGWNFYIMPV